MFSVCLSMGPGGGVLPGLDLVLFQRYGSFTLYVFFVILTLIPSSYSKWVAQASMEVFTLRLPHHDKLLCSPLQAKPNCSHKSYRVNGPVVLSCLRYSLHI